MSNKPYANVYRRADTLMVRGQGVYLYDDADKAYLDCASGIAVNALGHSHPRVVEALKAQADQLWHCSNNYRNPQLERFAKRLTDASALDQVFFCSSGAEAVDSAIKFIRRYHYVRQTGRNRIITFHGGFHGRAISCISAGGNDAAREGYHPLLEGFDQVEFNHIDAVKAVLSDQTAAILIEPVQGEGGVNSADESFLQALRALCDAHGMLLAFDEVQCGYGRCGALFTHEVFGVTPDLITCAKGIGNGFPLGAVLMSAAVGETLTPGCHGSTYGSNPLAMAVGNAVLDEMQQAGFFEHVQMVGAHLKAQLEAVAADYPALIGEVRGFGLMLGLQMRVPARPISDALRENGLLVAPAYGDVLRFIPPLIMTIEQADEAAQKLRKTLETL
jgi:acetylornithine/N-succinyldiaminopimelate aminotransferase